ncbi:MAG TPA: twin-arginine translocation signal domain-containing protein [Gammaproteobacteria bacterium]|nr:twin-arginine translocation signal domain-containing protein [Gammaproteobacteria bacterium]
MNKHHAAERRRFLKGIAAAGGAAAVTTVFASGLIATDPGGTAVRKIQQPESSGYRETDHIREYYRTLRS